jgi:hypothetical protein
VIQDYDETLIEPLAIGSLILPVLRIGLDPEVPTVQLKIGDKLYRYDRSFPSKGYGAVMPEYLAEQLAADREPLLVERGKRYYLYFAGEAAAA